MFYNKQFQRYIYFCFNSNCDQINELIIREWKEGQDQDQFHNIKSGKRQGKFVLDTNSMGSEIHKMALERKNLVKMKNDNAKM
jgi:hypothetical protein